VTGQLSRVTASDVKNKRNIEKSFNIVGMIPIAPAHRCRINPVELSQIFGKI
jgi:hypothetical protein